MKHVILSGIAFLLILVNVQGQIPMRDSVLSQVRQQVRQNHFDSALNQLETAIWQYPGDPELTVMKGRVLGWNGQYSKAVSVLKPLADSIPHNLEAADVLSRIYYWSERYDSSSFYANQYLLHQPRSTDMRMILAHNLEQLGRFKEASAQVDTILSIDKQNSEALKFQRNVKHRNYSQLSLSYLNSASYRPDYNAVHYAYAEFARKTDHTTLVARTTLGHGASQWQLQYEADFYQAFGKAGYMFLTAGIAPGSGLFPSFRSGAEYFYPVARKLEASLGYRSLKFPGNAVVLLTGQSVYTAGHIQLSYRPFYDLKTQLFSHAAGFQHSDEKKERLIRLDLQYGNAPFLNLPNNQFYTLRAFRTGLQYQKSFNNGFSIRPVLLYEYEQYQVSKYRSRTNFQLIVSKKLGWK